MKLEVDTIKLKESGESISKLADDLDTNFTGLFKRVLNVREDQIWRGKSADEYVGSVTSSKDQYFDYASTLKVLGEYMKEYAEQLESATTGNESEEL